MSTAKWRSCTTLGSPIKRELEYLSKAIEILEKEPSEELAGAYLGISVPYLWSGELKKSIEFWEKAVELGRKLNNPKIQAWTSYARVEVADITEKDGALQGCQEAIAFLAKNNEVREAGHAYYHKVLWYMEVKGAIKETLEAITEAHEYASKVNHYTTLFALKHSRFNYCLESGEWRKAREIAEEFFLLSKRTPNNKLIKISYLQALGQLLFITGELDKAEEAFLESIQSAGRFGLPNRIMRSYVGLCRVLLEEAKYDNAEKILAETYAISRKWELCIPNVMRYVELLSLMVEYDVLVKKDKELARNHLQELKSAANQIGEAWANAHYLRSRAMLQTLENSFEAIESYLKSIEIWKRLEWPYELARTLYLLAKEYSNNNDAESAKVPLTEALEIFRKLGAKRDEQLIVALQDQIKRAIEALVPRNERGLAAIMFTDIVGYTKLSQSDEPLALKLLEEHRKVLRPIFKRHFGREVDTIGDAFLVEFASALEAARCAIDIHAALNKRATSSSTDSVQQVLKVRIGIHLGDVIRKEKNIYGDAVNIASRIEPLAEPGGICITQQVYDQIRSNSEFYFKRLGPRELKNVNLLYEIYQIAAPLTS
jgi:class 3 adenylate cyclase